MAAVVDSSRTFWRSGDRTVAPVVTTRTSKGAIIAIVPTKGAINSSKKRVSGIDQVGSVHLDFVVVLSTGAGRGLHAGSGGDTSGGAANGASKFALIGTLVGALAHSRAAASGFGAYGAAMSVYSQFTARERDVVYPKDIVHGDRAGNSRHQINECRRIVCAVRSEMLKIVTASGLRVRINLNRDASGGV